MADEDYLPTPSNYATPDQLKSVREYAQALLYGKGQQPVHHWAQGLSNVVSALVGGKDLYNAGQSETASRRFATAASQPMDPGDETAAHHYQVDHSQTPTGGQPLAFNGDPADGPGGNAPDAPAAITRALGLTSSQPPLTAPGAPAKVPAPRVAMDPTSGQAIIQPGLAPHKVPVTRQQLLEAQSSPWISPEQKKFIQDAYYSQRQPIALPTMGGSVLINPKDPTEQQYIPELNKGNIKGRGGTEFPAPWYVDANRKPHYLTPDDPEGSPTQQAPQGNQSLDDIPDLMKFAPDEGQAAPPAARPAAAPAGAAAPEGSPASVVQRGFGQVRDAINSGDMDPQGANNINPTMLGQGPPGSDSRVQTAQLIPKVFQDFLTEQDKRQTEYEANTEFAKEDVKSVMKKYDDIANVGKKAQLSLPVLKEARRLIEDPNFQQGFGADFRVDLQKVKALFGVNPKAAAANEAFEKIISGNILKDLGIELGGLGQVRVAEIDLLKRAAASKYNTLPANRAVLDLMIKAHEQANNVSKVTNAFMQGARLDKDGNLIVDAKGHPILQHDRPTNAGLDAFVKKYVDKHPLLTDDEIKNYNKTFDDDSKAPPKAAPKAKGKAVRGLAPPAGPLGTPPPAAQPGALPPNYQLLPD